jgi:Kef-type K+ transport system membrane component KefB
MKRFKNVLFYIITIGLFSVIIYWLLKLGHNLETGRGVVALSNTTNPFQDFLSSIGSNINHTVSLILLQIIVIVIVARFFGWIFKKVGQPGVIGEILAGIVLGPSLLGLYFPEVSVFLFPEESMGGLQIISQIGLILFMYVIGMELNVKALKSKAQDAVVISHASIIIPFTMGVALAYWVYRDFAPEHIDFTSFALFTGMALSITAFPVLARIIQEQGIHKTKLGTVVITCAAVDDITAWCLLASVIAIVKAGTVISSLYTILFAMMYVLFMIKVLRPFLKRIVGIYQSDIQISQSIVALFFVILLISSYVTEIIGIHALFGAFMAGAVIPESFNFRRLLIGKIEDVALILFLPIFFVISGLRTEIGLINDPGLWRITGLVILMAIVGKFVGSAFAAKYVGQSWKDSLTIGALMNTRGLMELVALNIGYELGVLKAEVFAMMVIMALVTTFMTGPILKLINFAFRKKEVKKNGLSKQPAKHRILIFFRNPERGASLVRLADGLSGKVEGSTSLTAIHLTSSEGLQQMDSDFYEKETFEPVISKAGLLHRNLITMFKISGDVSSDLAGIANKGNYDLLLMNLEESIFEGTFLGRALGFTTQIFNPERLINTVIGRERLINSSLIDNNTRMILFKTKVPVGILLDKKFDSLENIFVPVISDDDEFLITYSKKFISNINSRVSVYDFTDRKTQVLKDKLYTIEKNAPGNIKYVSLDEINEDFLDSQDLIMVSMEKFEKFVMAKKSWIDKKTSILILTNPDHKNAAPG